MKLIEYVIKLKDDTKNGFQSLISSFKKIDTEAKKSTDSISTNLKKLGNVAKGAGNAISVGIINPLKKVGSFATKAGGAITAMGAAIFGMATKAAADYQMLEARLTAVVGNAELAKKIFEETREFSDATPFKVDEMVNARLVLLQLGFTGMKSLKAIANAAAVAGVGIDEVANVVQTLEGDVLKKLNLQVQKNGDEFTILKHKGSKTFETVVKGSFEAKKALLDLMNQNYGGNLDRFSKTFLGRLSTIQGRIKTVFAETGVGWIDELADAVNKLDQKLQAVLKSDVLQQFGQVVGDHIGKAADLLDKLSRPETREEAIEDIKKTGEAFKAVGTQFGESATKVILDGALKFGKIAVKGMFDAFHDKVKLDSTRRREAAQEAMEGIAKRQGISVWDVMRGKAKNDKYGDFDTVQDEIMYAMDFDLKEYHAEFTKNMEQIEKFRKNISELNISDEAKLNMEKDIDRRTREKLEGAPVLDKIEATKRFRDKQKDAYLEVMNGFRDEQKEIREAQEKLAKEIADDNKRTKAIMAKIAEDSKKFIEDRDLKRLEKAVEDGAAKGVSKASEKEDKKKEEDKKKRDKKEDIEKDPDPFQNPLVQEMQGPPVPPNHYFSNEYKRSVAQTKQNETLDMMRQNQANLGGQLGKGGEGFKHGIKNKRLGRKEPKPKDIVSFSDRDMSTGDMFEALRRPRHIDAGSKGIKRMGGRSRLDEKKIEEKKKKGKLGENAANPQYVHVVNQQGGLK